MKNIVCICCPIGCWLSVDEQHDYAVTGNSCTRGEAYGKQEVRDPQRIVTSTVAVRGSNIVRCPVKTDRTIPKHLLFEAIKTLDRIVVPAPIALGQVIVPDVCHTGANFIATRKIE
ncbi:MAG: DUF1667 domain-containing protein [Treponema sp.]|nr:DUF1667 domain-containing protein [Treponema sp.]